MFLKRAKRLRWRGTRNSIKIALNLVMDQNQRDFRNIGNDHQADEIDGQKRQYAEIDAAERRIEDRLRGKQIETERRRIHAETEIDRHDDAKMNRIDADRAHDRQQ